MTRRIRRRRSLAALLLGSLFASPAWAAQVETFVLGVGGDSSGPLALCFTYSAPTQVSSFFGPMGLGEPIGGYAGCGIQGGYASQTAATGPLADSRTGSFAWPTAGVSGSTDASARHGELSASLDLTYTGLPNSFQIAGFEGFGRADEALTITSPSFAAGTSGSVRFTVTVTGDLSLTQPGAVDVEVHYYFGAVGPFFGFRAQATNPATVPFFTSASGLGLGGFAAVPGAISGTDDVPTLTHAFTFGTPFDWKLGLLTYGYETVHGGVGSSDWHVELTGIEVFGPGGQPVTDFSVASASGTAYGSDGVIHPPCANGLDDDGDGLVDAGADPGCYDASASSIENPRCQDGLDNDGDGKIDFDGGAAANGGVPLAPLDGYCTLASGNRERPPSSCGLGGELLLLLAAWRRVRRLTSGTRLT